MRVLISAYACEPGKGSEPGVGLAAVLGAARRHEVWVITRQNNIEPVRELLAGHPLADRIHLVGLDLSERALRLKRRLGTLGLYWYYDRWQKRAGELAGELDSEVGFDVIHHITFATIWARIGVARIQKPLVLGPLGGFAVTPPRLWQVLGARGLLDELTRRAIRPLMSLLAGGRRALDAANVLLLQNPTALGRRRPSDRVRVVPNGLVGAESPIEAITDDPPRIVFAGRLIGWKGPVLAVEAMRHLDHSTAVLDIYGSGPERSRLEQAVATWGLEDRVSFTVRCPGRCFSRPSRGRRCCFTRRFTMRPGSSSPRPCRRERRWSVWTSPARPWSRAIGPMTCSERFQRHGGARW